MKFSLAFGLAFGVLADDCDVGDFCVTGNCKLGTYRWGLTSCLACPAGTDAFKSDQHDGFCRCPMGTQRNEHSVCIPCGPGFFSYRYDKSEGQCQPCNEGSYAPSGSDGPLTYSGGYPAGPAGLTTKACLPCPLGQMSELGATSCHSCPIGTFNNYPGGVCLACPAGKTNNAVGSLDCPLWT